MSETPTIFMFDSPNGKLRISPPLFPENTQRRVNPSDLSKFAPYGNSIYGYDKPQPESDPFHMGPKTEPTGGILFFDNGISEEDFMALARISSMWGNLVERKYYAAYYQEAPNLKEASKYGYIRQLRLIDLLNLRHDFNAISDEEFQTFPQQELTMAEAFWAFIQSERKAWGTHFGGKLEHMFGGDGDFAREQLSFGFIVENANGIYRLWSRAWLVTK